MATTILIVCPECGKQIKAPDNVLGKRVKCKFCQGAFVATKGTAKPPAGKPAKPPADKPAKPATGNKPAAGRAAGSMPIKRAVEEDEEDNDPNPYGITDMDMAYRCPSCANEMESEDAIICLTCGYNTQTREHARTRKVHDLGGGEHFLWLLPGIGCLLLVLAAIGFATWYVMKIEDLVGTDEWYGALLSHGGIKLWVVIMALFVIYYAGKFTIKRLILHPKPPEVEKKK
jgi:DNA-directed RNA polymerase subunit RPC12/RpoP